MKSLRQKRKEFYVEIRRTKKNIFFQQSREKFLKKQQDKIEDKDQFNNLLITLTSNDIEELNQVLYIVNEYTNKQSLSSFKISKKNKIDFIKQIIEFYEKNKSCFQSQIAYLFKNKFFHQILNLYLSNEDAILTKLDFLFEILVKSKLYETQNKSNITKLYIFIYRCY